MNREAVAQWSGSESRSSSSDVGALRANQVYFFISVVLAILTFFLVNLGGVVRNAGAGLSCPDWPLCFGQVVPPMDIRVFLEWFHRLVAGAVSVAIVALSVIAYSKKELRRTIGPYFAVANVVLLLQIILGGLTVIGLLNPHWVSSHLAMGQALWMTVVLIALRFGDLAGIGPAARGAGAARDRRALFVAGAVVTGLVYFQIILGGVVSSHYAGLACPDFPLCNGQWIPPLDGGVKFQILHRTGALATTIAVLGFAYVVVSRPELSRRARTFAFALPLIVAVQVFLGIGSVLMGLPVLMSVGHLAVAATLLGSMAVVVYEIRRP